MQPPQAKQDAFSFPAKQNFARAGAGPEPDAVPTPPKVFLFPKHGDTSESDAIVPTKPEVFLKVNPWLRGDTSGNGNKRALSPGPSVGNGGDGGGNDWIEVHGSKRYRFPYDAKWDGGSDGKDGNDCIRPQPAEVDSAAAAVSDSDGDDTWVGVSGSTRNLGST